MKAFNAEVSGAIRRGALACWTPTAEMRRRPRLLRQVASIDVLDG